MVYEMGNSPIGGNDGTRESDGDGAAVAAAGLAAAGTGAGAGASGATVVATGLNNPRALALGPDGAIYVAEAGRAGATCLDKKQQTCIGTTSAVARLSGGKAQPVVTGVLSGGARDGTFATGIDGVSVASDGTILMAVTAAPECAPIKLPPPLSSQVGRVLAAKPGAAPHALADVATIECRTNPDGTDRNSNPYGVYALGPDHALVLDAGGNDLLEVTGTKAKVIAVFPKNGKNHPCPPPSPRAPTVSSTWASSPRGRATARRGSSAWSRGRSRRSTRPGSRPSPASPRPGQEHVRDRADHEHEVPEALRRRDQGGPRRHPYDARPGTLFSPSGAVFDRSGNLYVSNFSVLPATTPKKGPYGGRGGQVVRFSAS